MIERMTTGRTRGEAAAPREAPPNPDAADPAFPDLELGDADRLYPGLLARLRARADLARGGDAADRVAAQLCCRVPHWMDERLDAFVSRYNALRPHAADRITKRQLVTELLLLGMAAYPLPPTSEETHYL